MHTFRTVGSYFVNMFIVKYRPPHVCPVYMSCINNLIGCKRLRDVKIFSYSCLSCLLVKCFAYVCVLKPCTQILANTSNKSVFNRVLAESSFKDSDQMDRKQCNYTSQSLSKVLFLNFTIL